MTNNLIAQVLTNTCRAKRQRMLVERVKVPSNHKPIYYWSSKRKNQQTIKMWEEISQGYCQTIKTLIKKNYVQMLSFRAVSTIYVY